jgi:peptide/nickel transport system permease protein
MLVASTLLAAATAPWIAAHDPTYQDREAAHSAPGPAHWLGTDEFGRDLWSRYVYGTRWSVSMGVAATSVVLLLGWSVGSLAGFQGGIVDRILMGAAELFLSVPWMYLLIAVRAALPLNLPPRAAFGVLLAVIALVGWARPARLARGLVLQLRQREYVEAALGFGVSKPVAYFRHVLPATYGLLATQGLLLLPRFVLAEVALSYMGLGLGEPEPSWGTLILPLKQVYLLREEWWRCLPLLLMLPFFAGITVLARLWEGRISR